ncbi:MAG: hypothetical protein JWQ14_528 [Adhaeribacter sp.]|nr:hypothetical protein [Adhaeribacter sp.]
MPESTAKYLRQVFQLLALVVIFLCIFLISWAKPVFSYPPVTDSSATIRILADGPFSLVPQIKRSGNLSFTAIHPRILQEATIPLFALSFHPQLVISRFFSPAYFIITQQRAMRRKAFRGAGESLISRIFPVIIQPNAP